MAGPARAFKEARWLSGVKPLIHNQAQIKGTVEEVGQHNHEVSIAHLRGNKCFFFLTILIELPKMFYLFLSLQCIWKAHIDNIQHTCCKFAPYVRVHQLLGITLHAFHVALRHPLNWGGTQRNKRWGM